ncbi:MAG: hypothetical protein AB1508_13280 [Pseudomonadota bacterium]
MAIIKPALSAEKIFVHATRFHKSFEQLLNSVRPEDGGKTPDQEIGVVAHPAMVLSAFASELYLKCLLCVETGETPRDHNLKRLFDKLAENTRRDVEDLWDIDIRQHDKRQLIGRLRTLPKGKDMRFDLRSALELGAEAFIKLRYYYEEEDTYFLLLHFPIVLRVAILKLFPLWDEILPPPSKNLLRP